jgi:hypothetical protein
MFATSWDSNVSDRTLVRGRSVPASMPNALDDPEPVASRQASAASKYAEARAKQSVRLSQQ